MDAVIESIVQCHPKTPPSSGNQRSFRMIACSQKTVYNCLLVSTSLAVKIFHAPNYQCQPLPSAFKWVSFQAIRAVGKIMVHGVDGAGEMTRPL